MKVNEEVDTKSVIEDVVIFLTLKIIRYTIIRY